jgi:hypothetical protein
MKKVSLFMAIAAATSLASCTAQSQILKQTSILYHTLSVWLKLKV